MKKGGPKARERRIKVAVKVEHKGNVYIPERKVEDVYLTLDASSPSRFVFVVKRREKNLCTK